jgi:hypothetical protein
MDPLCVCGHSETEHGTAPAANCSRCTCRAFEEDILPDDDEDENEDLDEDEEGGEDSDDEAEPDFPDDEAGDLDDSATDVDVTIVPVGDNN